MVIIKKSTLAKFWAIHTDAEEPLLKWYKTVKDADWRSFQDIKNTFNSADYVGNERYVFNIKGNKYRIVALIFLDKRTVFIKFVGKHSDYDKIDVLNV